jgi:hypothetical protein
VAPWPERQCGTPIASAEEDISYLHDDDRAETARGCLEVNWIPRESASPYCHPARWRMKKNAARAAAACIGAEPGVRRG